MKAYLVDAKAWAPYPIERQLTIKASNAATAAARATRELRDAIPHKRRISYYLLKITPLK